MKRVLIASAMVLAGASWARDGGTAAGKYDLGLPSFGEIPKGADLHKPKARESNDGPTVTSAGAAYSIVKVQHAKSFARTPTGSVAVGALEAIPLSGKPLSTEKFTTVVRIKSPQRAAASVELAIVDTRGETLMSSSGQVSFRGTKGDEVDYAIDWDPTPCRGAGDFELLVRVGGQALGSYPLKLAEK
jgi:hypothetical protein